MFCSLVHLTGTFCRRTKSDNRSHENRQRACNSRSADHGTYCVAPPLPPVRDRGPMPLPNILLCVLRTLKRLRILTRRSPITSRWEHFGEASRLRLRLSWPPRRVCGGELGVLRVEKIPQLSSDSRLPVVRRRRHGSFASTMASMAVVSSTRCVSMTRCSRVLRPLLAPLEAAFSLLESSAVASVRTRCRRSPKASRSSWWLRRFRDLLSEGIDWQTLLCFFSCPLYVSVDRRPSRAPNEQMVSFPLSKRPRCAGNSLAPREAPRPRNRNVRTKRERGITSRVKRDASSHGTFLAMCTVFWFVCTIVDACLLRSTSLGDGGRQHRKQGRRSRQESPSLT